MGKSSGRKKATQPEGTQGANITPLKRIAPYFAFTCSGLLLGVLISIDHSSADVLFRIGLGFAALIVGAIGVVFSRELAVNRERLSVKQIGQYSYEEVQPLLGRRFV
jgi:hypothetical protein